MQSLSTHGIGASEIAVVLGLNPYRTPYELFEEKIGEREPFAGNDATRWGQLTEPAILAAYSEKTGAALHTPPESLFHPALEWARATPDAIVLRDRERGAARDNWVSVVQAKNTGHWPGLAWADGPPVHVIMQVQWELYVTGLPRGEAVASIGGGYPEIFPIERDESLIDGAVAAATDFWQRVQTRSPPVVDDTRDCARYWTRRATPGTTALVAYDAAATVIATYKEAWLAQRHAEAELMLAKNDIAALCALAGASGVDTPDGAIRWQERRQRRVDWEAIARALAPSDAALEIAVRDHTTEGEPVRAVIAPRAWGAGTSSSRSER